LGSLATIKDSANTNLVVSASLATVIGFCFLAASIDRWAAGILIVSILMAMAVIVGGSKRRCCH
jgi:hypothetical protein